MGFGKNEDYYNRDAIKLENIHYEVIKEAVTGYNLFNEGQLDMADIYGEYVKQNAANEELQTVLTSYIHYFKMNQKRDGKDTIFANENVRKAVYYAIDKEALVKDVLSDGSEAINGFIPNNFVFNPKLAKIFEKMRLSKDRIKPLHSLTGKKPLLILGIRSPSRC